MDMNNLLDAKLEHSNAGVICFAERMELINANKNG